MAADIVEADCLKVGQHDFRFGKVRHRLGQILICVAVGDHSPDLGDNLPKVESVTPPQDPVLGFGYVEQADPSARANHPREFVKEGGQLDQVAESESAGGAIGRGSREGCRCDGPLLGRVVGS